MRRLHGQTCGCLSSNFSACSNSASLTQVPKARSPIGGIHGPPFLAQRPAFRPEPHERPARTDEVVLHSNLELDELRVGFETEDPLAGVAFGDELGRLDRRGAANHDAHIAFREYP